MGQKTHPIGLRLGIIKTWDSRWFGRRNYAELLKEDLLIKRYLKKRLYQAGISRITIERKGDRITIGIKTARPGLVIGRKGEQVDKLSEEMKQLTKKQLIRFYKMRWGIEVEFRGLKQTIDKHTLRCRNSDRLLVELDWSIRGMAYAELIALREQIPSPAAEGKPGKDYDPRDRSLANTIRALRKCMRNLNKDCAPEDGLLYQLSQAMVQRYENRTDKRARYRPKNPDKKPLGDPTVRKMTAEEREKLRKHQQSLAA